MTPPLDEQADTPQVAETPAKPAAVVIKPRNRLKEKVGEFRVDKRTILRAHDSLLRMREVFFERVSADAARLAVLADSLGEVADPVILDEIKGIAHNIRGLGTTFNFSMITMIGDSLYRFADNGAAFTGPQLEVVRLHCHALCRVIENRIEGNGGRLGADLIDSLAAAAAKFTG